MDWKRILAKEWLIILACIAIAFILGNAIPFFLNIPIKERAAVEYKDYNDNMMKYVQTNLQNWVPDTTTNKIENEIEKSPTGGDVLVRPLHEPPDYPDVTFEKKLAIIKTFKNINPKYKDIDDFELEKQLPQIKYNEVPKRPQIYYQNPPDIWEMLLFASFLYIGSILIRTTKWAFLYLKKRPS
jgi:hypothetical protein